MTGIENGMVIAANFVDNAVQDFAYKVLQAPARALSLSNQITDLNSIDHALVSAYVALSYGQAKAKKMGNVKENDMDFSMIILSNLSFDDRRNALDSWGDQWNNSIGRQITKWAIDNGYEYTPHAIDRLILDAYRHGGQQLGRADDGEGILFRTNHKLSLTQEQFQVPPNPVYNGPSANWLSDPFNEPDFTFGTNNDHPLLGDLAHRLGHLVSDAQAPFERAWESTESAREDSSEWLSDLLGSIRILRDPLVLDLDGDGIELSSLVNSTAHFDLDGNGFAEKTGWVSPDDGLLVRDVNGNGTIDNTSELFGNSFQDGFTVLKQFDSNNDGKISSSDSVFQSLSVWKDLNQDGVTDAGELVSLSSLGISEISVNYTRSSAVISGNPLIGSSSFMMNGVSMSVAAVNFATDVSDTHFVPPMGFFLDSEVMGLPNLKGYGNVPDLWTAMSLDADLKQTVKDLVSVASGSSTIGDLVRVSGTGGSYVAGLFDKMISQWAGFSDNPTASQLADVAAAFQGREAPLIWRGSSQFLEAFETLSTGYALRFVAQLPDLHIGKSLAIAFSAAGGFEAALMTDWSYDDLESMWGDAVDFYETTIPFSDKTAGLRYDLSSDSLIGNMDAYIAQLGLDVIVNPISPWAGLNAWSATNGAIIKALGYSDVALAYQYATGHDALEILRAGGVTIQGSGSSDFLASTSQFTTQRDLMIGGFGNDTLYGGQGSDTYLFEIDFGNDVISDSLGDRDEIVFKGFILSDATFSNPSGNDLLVTMSSGESVLVSSYFSPATSYYAPTIESISFDDRFSLTVREIGDLITAGRMSSGSESVTGFLAGTTFSSSAGNDTLIGLSGNDTFYYGPDDGFDLIRDKGGFDILILDKTEHYRISYETDETFSDLIIKIDGVQSVIIENGLSESVIDRFIFEDGSQKIFNAIWSSLVTTSASFTTSISNLLIFGSLSADLFSMNYGDSIVHGFDGNDTFNIGGSGSNTVYAGGGNDSIYIYGLTNDVQHIFAGSGDDTINTTMKSIVADMGDGNDFAQGSSSYDEIYGGNGDDYIMSGGGFDLLSGGEGVDSVEFYGESKIEVDLLLGTVKYSNNSTMALSGFENVYATSGNDHIIGDNGANMLHGVDGNDILEGGDGGDFLNGGTGNDTLLGGAGYDTIHSGVGNDYIDGGLDWDTVIFDGRTQSQMLLTTTNGEISITDISNGTGNLGTDTLIGIESLNFSDGFVNIASPIIFDLDGNGVHLIDKLNSSVAFDFDDDGILDNTGWFSSSDGMLVFDENLNGKVDGANEVSFTNIEGALSDLDGLRKKFDSNDDGIFSALDDDFSKFSIWQDANGDGVSDAGEVRSLNDLGILSINLTATAVNRDWALGENIVVGAGTYETANGTFGFQDVGFAYDSSKALSIDVPEFVESQWQTISMQDGFFI